MRDFWQGKAGGPSGATTMLVPVIGILGLIAAIAAGLVVGGAV
jgi:hypothetical protein